MRGKEEEVQGLGMVSRSSEGVSGSADRQGSLPAVRSVPLELLHQVQHYHGGAVSPYEISEVLLSTGDIYT